MISGSLIVAAVAAFGTAVLLYRLADHRDGDRLLYALTGLLLGPLALLLLLSRPAEKFGSARRARSLRPTVTEI